MFNLGRGIKMLCRNDERRHKVYNPVNSELFAKRVEETFSSFYLTMVSIIQGVAFYFAMNILYEMMRDNLLTKISLLYWFASLFAIAVVSYEYTTVSAVYRWPMRFVDVIIPLLLGLFEILPFHLLYITFKSDPEKIICWWFSYSALSLVGIMAYINSLFNTAKCTYDAKDKSSITVFKENITILIEKIILSLLGFASGVIFAIVLFFYPLNGNNMLSAHFLSLTLFGVMLATYPLTEQHWFKSIHHSYGWKFWYETFKGIKDNCYNVAKEKKISFKGILDTQESSKGEKCMICGKVVQHVTWCDPISGPACSSCWHD